MGPGPATHPGLSRWLEVLAIPLRTIIGCDRVADGERLEADLALTRPVRRSAPALGVCPQIPFREGTLAQRFRRCRIFPQS